MKLKKTGASSNHEDLIIRASDQTDAENIRQLVASFGIPITHEDMLFRLKLYGKNNLNRSWVAIDMRSNFLVGWIAVSVSKRVASSSAKARIVSLIVQKNYRRLGIGRRLIQHVEQYIEKIGCSYLELSTNAQNPHVYAMFYQQLGYKNITEEKKFVIKKIS